MLTQARAIQAVPLANLAPRQKLQAAAANLAAGSQIATLERLLDLDGD